MKVELSKRGLRRYRCTSNFRERKELCDDGKTRLVRRARFDIGRFLDRSKYKP